MQKLKPLFIKEGAQISKNRGHYPIDWKNADYREGGQVSRRFAAARMPAREKRAM